MGTAFTQFFAFFVALFTAMEKFAGALVHLATWTEESAGTFSDEARFMREQKIEKLMRDAKIEALPKPGEKTKHIEEVPAIG